MAAKHARGLKPAPGVVKLDIVVIAVMRQSVLTAVADILPSVKNAQNGYWKKTFNVSKQKEAYLILKRVRLSLQNLRAGHLLVAALQLLLLAPRVCQHGHLLVQLLISHGLIDRNNPH